MYQWHMATTEDPKIVVPNNMWNYCHVFTLILSRAIVIGVKYGDYSDETFQILRKIKLSDEMLINGLIFTRIS